MEEENLALLTCMYVYVTQSSRNLQDSWGGKMHTHTHKLKELNSPLPL